MKPVPLEQNITCMLYTKKSLFMHAILFVSVTRIYIFLIVLYIINENFNYLKYRNNINTE